LCRSPFLYSRWRSLDSGFWCDDPFLLRGIVLGLVNVWSAGQHKHRPFRRVVCVIVDFWVASGTQSWLNYREGVHPRWFQMGFCGRDSSLSRNIDGPRGWPVMLLYFEAAR
jgi:hypothetical protein